MITWANFWFRRVLLGVFSASIREANYTCRWLTVPARFRTDPSKNASYTVGDVSTKCRPPTMSTFMRLLFRRRIVARKSSSTESPLHGADSSMAVALAMSRLRARGLVAAVLCALLCAVAHAQRTHCLEGGWSKFANSCGIVLVRTVPERVFVCFADHVSTLRRLTLSRPTSSFHKMRLMTKFASRGNLPAHALKTFRTI